MNTNEVLKLALEALEYIYEGANNQGPHTGISWRCVSKKAAPVITALREALAQQALDKMAENARELGLDYEPAQQEPVAWYRDEDGIRIYYESKVWDDATPLYTFPPAQRTWVGLTDEETGHWAADFLAGAKWAEAKLRSKNNG